MQLLFKGVESEDFNLNFKCSGFLEIWRQKSNPCAECEEMDAEKETTEVTHENLKFLRYFQNFPFISFI